MTGTRFANGINIFTGKPAQEYVPVPLPVRKKLSPRRLARGELTKAEKAAAERAHKRALLEKKP